MPRRLIATEVAISGLFPLFRSATALISGGFELLVLGLVFGREAPRRMVGLRRRAALWARLDRQLVCSLQGTCLFEAPMASLFHGLAPRQEKGWNGQAVYPLRVAIRSGSPSQDLRPGGVSYSRSGLLGWRRWARTPLTSTP